MLPNDLRGAASSHKTSRIEPANFYRCSDTVETICARCGGFYFTTVLTLTILPVLSVHWKDGGWYCSPLPSISTENTKGFVFPALQDKTL